MEERSWNAGVFPEYYQNVHEYSRNVHGRSQNVPGVFPERSWSVPRRFLEHSQNVLMLDSMLECWRNQECSRNIPGSKESSPTTHSLSSFIFSHSLIDQVLYKNFVQSSNLSSLGWLDDDLTAVSSIFCLCIS